jgi:hypothetical protein
MKIMAEERRLDIVPELSRGVMPAIAVASDALGLRALPLAMKPRARDKVALAQRARCRG